MIVKLLLLLKVIIMKDYENKWKNNENFSLCKKYNLSKEQRRILHDYISGQNYSYHEIEQIIKELFLR